MQGDNKLLGEEEGRCHCGLAEGHVRNAVMLLGLALVCCSVQF